MKFILENFKSMTGGHVPGVSKQLQHRSIYGFIPHYFTLVDDASDSNLKQKILPPYPLVLAPTLTQVQGYTNVYPTVMIANDSASLGNVILSTDKWHFYIEDSSQTDLGIPNGTPASNVGIDAIVFNGKILTSHPLQSTTLWHGAINATPAWTASTGTSLNQGTHVLEKFGDEAMVTDAGSSLGPRQYVRIVNSSFVVSAGIDLGGTWDIMDIKNYQDRYLALFAVPSTSPRLLKETHCYLWNGVSGSSWDYKAVLRGHYRCSIMRDGELYVFTQVNQSVFCYRLEGTAFREIGRIKNTIISTLLNIPKTRIAVEGDFFVLLATLSGNTASVAPLYWNPFTGDSFVGEANLSSQPYRSVLIASDPITSKYVRYLSWVDSGVTQGNLYKMTMENATKSIAAEYKSNFIPAPYDEKLHAGALTGRVKTDRITIEYSVKPPSANDILTLTLTTKDELISETYNTYTASVKNTTANSTNARIEDKRAIIENVGALATEFAIDLTAAVTTTSWDLIIRRIVIDYTPIAHLS